LEESVTSIRTYITVYRNHSIVNSYSWSRLLWDHSSHCILPTIIKGNSKLLIVLHHRYPGWWGEWGKLAGALRSQSLCVWCGRGCQPGLCNSLYPGWRWRQVPE